MDYPVQSLIGSHSQDGLKAHALNPQMTLSPLCMWENQGVVVQHSGSQSLLMGQL